MRTRSLSVVLAVVLGTASAEAAVAPAAGRGLEPRPAPRQDESGVEAQRPAMVRSIVERFRSEMQPADRDRNLLSGEELISAALGKLSAERLLEASRLGTYQELRSFLQPQWQKASPAFMAHNAGGPLTPNLIGDSFRDLVYTPLTPCRIIDTRIASDPLLQGPIGPFAGRHFQVDMPDYSPQGGFAGSCGLPAFNVEAVSINVTTTEEDGRGNLRVIEEGGGLPLAALLSYRQGVNLSNAAVLRSGTTGADDLYIYSGVSATQVVVDIMGYFAAPEATPLDCLTIQTDIPLAANASGEGTAVCPAGYAVSGGGAYDNGAGATITINKLDVAQLVPNEVFCALTNNTGTARTSQCHARCCRIPGR